MKRIVIKRPGGYEALETELAPDPAPGPAEVAIDVGAVGINYADCVTRMGLYASAKQLVGYPITPGFEVAGRVRAVGDDVRSVAVGDRVMGVTLFNGYSTRLALPESQVFPVPDNIGIEQAAGIPCVFLTAWFGLIELANARPGDRVLIHSAAGGVGGALTQLARHRGCRVTAVVGAGHKVAVARALGADDVIDKSAQPLWQAAERISSDGYDVILDANGVATLKESYRHLAPAGRLVVYGFHTMLPRGRGRPRWLSLAWHYLRTPRFSPLKMTLQNRSVLAFNLSFLSQKADLLAAAMREITGLMAAGALAPLSVTPYDFDAVAVAHRALQTGQTTGKLILTVPPDAREATAGPG